MTTSEQLQAVQERLAQLDPNNRDNLAEIQSLKTQEIELLKAIEAEKAEQAKQERITTAKAETEAALESMDIDGTPLQDFIIDEQSYRYVLIAFQSMLNAKDAKYIGEIAGAAEREAVLQFQLKQKDSIIEQKENELLEANAKAAEFEKKANTLEFERDKALEVRDNAAAEIESMKAEIEGYKLAVDEKQEQIDKLRAEIAVGAKAAVEIDKTEQLRKAKEEYLNSRIKVTNIRWEDEKFHNLKLAELVLDGPTGEDPKYGLIGETGKAGDTIRFHPWTKGKYLEVTAEEAARFRAEAQQAAATAEASAAESTTVPVSDSPLVTEVQPVAEVSTFQAEAQPVVGLDTSDPQGVLPKTIEERIAALEADVEELKSRVMA